MFGCLPTTGDYGGGCVPPNLTDASPEGMVSTGFVSTGTARTRGAAGPPWRAGKVLLGGRWGAAPWWGAATWPPGPLVLPVGVCQVRDLSSPDCRDREGNVPWLLPATQPVLSAVPPGPPWAAWTSRTCWPTGSARREHRAARQEGGQGEYLQSPHPDAPWVPRHRTQPHGVSLCPSSFPPPHPGWRIFLGSPGPAPCCSLTP